jgi:hypothetical protein
MHLTNVGVEQIGLQLHTREISGSGLSSETGYPEDLRPIEYLNNKVIK